MASACLFCSSARETRTLLLLDTYKRRSRPASATREFDHQASDGGTGFGTEPIAMWFACYYAGERAILPSTSCTTRHLGRFAAEQPRLSNQMWISDADQALRIIPIRMGAGNVPALTRALRDCRLKPSHSQTSRSTTRAGNAAPTAEIIVSTAYLISKCKKAPRRDCREHQLEIHDWTFHKLTFSIILVKRF